MKKGLLFLILLSAVLKGEAQLFNNTVVLEPKIHAGLSLPLYDALDYLITDDIYAFSISVAFPSCGKDYWEELYNYPTTGIGFSLSGLGNNEIFGKANTLFGFVNTPIFKRGEKFSVNYQLSIGTSYITKVFDLHNNPLNRAIGSHFNVYIRLGADMKIKLTPLNEIVLEGGIMHFSNGKTRSPNYGINIATFSLGINHNFNNTRIQFEKQPVPEITKNYLQTITLAAGSKTFDNLSGKRYFISSVTYNAERVVNVKNRIGLGADLSYDGSIGEALAGEDGLPENDHSKMMRFGMHLSYAARFRKLITGIQIGHYIYSKYTVLTPVYSRLSVKYMLNENIQSFVAVKSHLGKADCLEFGLGYTW